MTAIPVSGLVSARPSAETRAIGQLAKLEARRMVRHPAFLIGLVIWCGFLAALPWLDYPDADYSGDATRTGIYEWSTIGAFGIGVFGLIAANRVARGVTRGGDVISAAPLSEPRRAMALCLACLVPGLLTLAGNTVTLLTWLLKPPVLAPGWEVIPLSDKVWVLATASLAGLGGPVLGVAIARWWRWPSAAAVAAVALVAICAVSVVATTSRMTLLMHNVAPFTIPDSEVPDSTHTMWHGGIPSARFAYVAGLVTLAALAAVAHGTTGQQRRRLQVISIVVGVLTLAALLVGTFLGPLGQDLGE